MSSDKPTERRQGISHNPEFSNLVNANQRKECEQFFGGFTSQLGRYCNDNKTSNCYWMAVLSQKQVSVNLPFLAQAIREEAGIFNTQDQSHFMQECLAKKQLDKQ